MFYIKYIGVGKKMTHFYIYLVLFLYILMMIKFDKLKIQSQKLNKLKIIKIFYIVDICAWYWG